MKHKATDAFDKALYKTLRFLGWAILWTIFGALVLTVAGLFFTSIGYGVLSLIVEEYNFKIWSSFLSGFATVAGLIAILYFFIIIVGDHYEHGKELCGSEQQGE